MTVRERFLAIVVLGFIVLAGAGLMISQFIWSPIRNRNHRIAEIKSEIEDLVDFLERFYRTPLLHEIKKLDVRRPLTALIDTGPQRQNANMLHIEMTVEALVLAGADKRKQLLPSVDWSLAGVDVLTSLCNSPTGLIMLSSGIGPTGPLGPPILAAPARQYGSIAAKDVFYGPQKVAEQAVDNVETTENVYLTDITHSGTKAEALSYALYDN